MTIELVDVWPERATYRPDEIAVLHVEVAREAGADALPRALGLHIRLTWLDDTVAEWSRTVDVAPGRTVLAIPLPLPATPFRGYGIAVAMRETAGHQLAEGSTAVDVLETWAQAPRYGFLADFALDDPHAEEHVAQLARYHINVAQFYDWMWRHHTLMPPAAVYTDAMGRVLSLATVRAKVAACRRFGIAALGYAAVYGAERDYATAHPEEVVYDSQGRPYSLAELFYIMNLHRGNPWRERILATMRDAVRDVPFDGLHLDQYGFPKEAAFDSRGEPCDVAADFAEFIDDARAAIQQPGYDVRVIFNAVENWPIEQVAPTDQDAVYIEVWPPYEDFRHLQELIVGAQRLAPDKQVILAAYMKPLGGAEGARLEQAEAATRLTSAAIWANGGFHLLLGERDGALYDPYYATYATLRPAFAREMRAYYDFVVRYMNVLSDRRLSLDGHVDGVLADVELPGFRCSPDGAAGAIWTIVRGMPGCTTISLINLTAAPHAHWNAPTPPAAPITRVPVRVRLDAASRVRRVFAASPDVDGGAPATLAFTTAPAGDGTALVTFELPTLHYWSLVVIATSSGDDPRAGGPSSYA